MFPDIVKTVIATKYIIKAFFKVQGYFPVEGKGKYNIVWTAKKPWRQQYYVTSDCRCENSNLYYALYSTVEQNTLLKTLTIS